MGFNAFKFHPEVAAGITAAQYVTPTPIQLKAIPPVMEGKDVMGLAQTGTGKTAAFALPILNRLMNGSRRCTRALIVAPTRELAEQINAAFGVFGKKTGLRSVAIYGGAGITPQVEKLRRGAEIVVACPGRLLDHIGRKTIDLSRIEVLVIDEADQMFDMGFFPDLRRIMGCLPRQRQNLLFSATMPKEILHLAQDVLHDPVTLRVGDSAPAVTVKHAIYPVAQHLKTPLLLELLHHAETKSVLVFTRTKHRTKRLAEQMVRAGYRAASLQGNLSQSQREAAMGGFRNGRFQILVATDIAARGIDVSNVSHVINYDAPNTTDAYIHRIGRTGRATQSGDAYTLVTGEDRLIVRDIERVLGSPIERRTLDNFDYKVAAAGGDREFSRAPRTSAESNRDGGRDGGQDRGKIKKFPQRAVQPPAGAAKPGKTSGKTFSRPGNRKNAVAKMRRHFA